MSAFNQLHLIRQVDLFTLRLFLSAVEEEQIGRAAIRENIAPSTATKRIQDLEAIAGIPLLERSAKGVVPSAAGAVFARYARSIIDSIEQLRAEMSAFTEGMRGKVAVASARSIIAPFLAQELKDYTRQFPMVELAVSEVENAEIIELVSRGDADIGVFAMENRLDLEGVTVTPYRRDRLVVVVPISHRLSAQSHVSFADLLPENIIALKALMGTFGDASRRAGAKFEPLYSVRSVGLAISLVQEEIGVTIIPECLLNHESHGKIASIELAEPWAVRSVHIATPRGRPLSPVADVFMKQLIGASGDDRAKNGKSEIAA